MMDSPSPTRQFLLSCLAGVMLTASFPPGKLSFLAWFALVPLYKALENQPPRKAFILGATCGMAHYLTLIYWIVTVLHHYGGLSFYLSLIPFILLCLYLSLFPAFFSFLTVLINRSSFPAMFGACFWVGLELARAHVITGFPWCLLGYTQYEHLPMIQVADITGVYGLSFLIVLVNGILYSLLRQRPKKYHLLWELPLTVMIIGSFLGYGYYRLSREQGEDTGPSRTINVLAVQPNIDQSVKWDPAYQEDTIETCLALTHSGYDPAPDLIVWPETSVPFFFQDDGPLARKVSSVASESGAAFLFGSPAYTRSGMVTRYYNRAYFLSPDSGTMQYYDKVHLVPFGEYIPLKKILFFIDRLVPAAGDFEAGEKISPLKDRDYALGLLICFEAVFPEISRVHAKKGANILINITNDAWFGRTSAPYQHLSMTVFRAIENRRPLIRAANTGFSAIILPRGEIIARTGLFTREIIKESIRIHRGASITFHTRFGDVFALLMGVIALARILFNRIQ